MKHRPRRTSQFTKQRATTSASQASKNKTKTKLTEVL